MPTRIILSERLYGQCRALTVKSLSSKKEPTNLRHLDRRSHRFPTGIYDILAFSDDKELSLMALW